ncbi:MAG TPA: LAGLIDADG family homing endonuclease, partial [Trueperaceae bacterium]|nr:LAGLIDADG family homing endonuclease [Trueperaceae bacterium]
AWQTGEPGLIYVDRINEHNPMRQALGDIKSTNPCVTADTWVHTHMGGRRVRDLVGRDFCAMVDGKRYGLESQGFFSTGVKPVFKVRTRRGFELRLTADHPLRKVTRMTRAHLESEWVPVGELAPGDRLELADQREAPLWAGPGTEAEGWALGLLVGDGTFLDDRPGIAALDFRGADAAERADEAAGLLRGLGHPLAKLWVTHGEGRSQVASQALGTLASRFGLEPGRKTVTDAVESGSGAFSAGFLRGLLDAVGSVQENLQGSQAKGVSVRLAQSDLPLLQRVQRMLARLGVLSTLCPERGGARDYAVKAHHELIVAGGNLQTFTQRVGFGDAAKRERLTGALGAYRRAPNRERFVDTITAIERDGEEEVFDVTVERVHEFDANGLRAHNCGEIPLYPGEPCDLGAMNLAAYVREPGKGMAGFDEPRFREDVATCIRFLDNVLDVNRFALEDNRAMSMKLRRLGLGVMGLADALIRMGYAYDTDEGRTAVDAMITSLREAATEASEALGEERGTFPLIADSALEDARRNIAVLTVAPTGTTSMLMGVSSGVEPVFAPFIYRKIGSDYVALVHPLFRELMAEHAPHPDYADGDEWDWDEVVEAVQENHGSVQGLDFVPDAVKAVLICAHDISPSDHVRMQGVVQRAFDGGKQVANSISKTINMPKHATSQDVFDAYALAFETGCKGITVYRDGSREFQVLSTKAAKPAERAGAGDAASTAATAVAATPAASLDAPKAPPAPASRSDRLPSEPLFERPLRLSGFTDAVKLMLPNGERRGFFVTVNNQDGLPTEVFIVSGKAGDEANADSEALGRVVSIALQYGVPAEAVIKTLRGINGGMYGSYHGRLVASKADLIAVALETAGAENVLNKGKACPDCGAPLRFEEGCQKCENCGYSKCG